MQIKTHCAGAEVSLHHFTTETPDASSFERHCHKTFELIYVVRGKGRYVVEGAEYPLLPDTVLLLRPYEFHYVCPEKSCPYERYVIHFEEAVSFEAQTTLAGFWGDGVSAGVYFPRGSADETVFHAFESLSAVQRFSEDGGYLNSMGKLMLRSIVTQILLLLSASRPEDPVIPEKNMLFEIIGYLNEHLNEPITLDDLSKRFFIRRYIKHIILYLKSKSGHRTEFAKKIACFFICSAKNRSRHKRGSYKCAGFQSVKFVQKL